MRKKDEAILGIFAVIAAIIIYIITLIGKVLTAIVDAIVYNKKPILIFLSVGIGIYLTYQIFVLLYFNSKRFKKIKESINEHITNSNNLNHYIQELKCSYVNIQSYDFGESRMVDTSNYNFKRKEWNKSIKSNHIHHCSASVCKNANNQPIKYFCKYFDVEKNEESLSNFERVLNDFTSVEQGKLLLQNEREKILKSISKSIPALISFFSKDRLIRKLGFEVVDFSNSYILFLPFNTCHQAEIVLLNVI